MAVIFNINTIVPKEGSEFSMFSIYPLHHSLLPDCCSFHSSPSYHTLVLHNNPSSCLSPMNCSSQKIPYSLSKISIQRLQRKRRQRMQRQPRRNPRESCTGTFGDSSKRLTTSRFPSVRNRSSSRRLNSDSTPSRRRTVAGAILSGMVEVSSPMAQVSGLVWDLMDTMGSLTLLSVVVW